MGRQQNLATCCSARKLFASTQIQVSITLKHILGLKKEVTLEGPI
jgi:hypothetical protein